MLTCRGDGVLGGPGWAGLSHTLVLETQCRGAAILGTEAAVGGVRYFLYNKQEARIRKHKDRLAKWEK